MAKAKEKPGKQFDVTSVLSIRTSVPLEEMLKAYVEQESELHMRLLSRAAAAHQLLVYALRKLERERKQK